MPAFDTARELKNVKKYDTANNTIMNENITSEAIMSAHKGSSNNESKARILTQEIDKQIKNYVAH